MRPWPRWRRAFRARSSPSPGQPDRAQRRVLRNPAGTQRLPGRRAGRPARGGRSRGSPVRRTRAPRPGRAAYADGVRRASGRDPLTGFCGNQHDPERAHEWTRRLRARRARGLRHDGRRPRWRVARLPRNRHLADRQRDRLGGARSPGLSGLGTGRLRPVRGASGGRPCRRPAGGRRHHPLRPGASGLRLALAPASRRKNAARWTTGRAGWPAAWRSTAAPAPSSRPDAARRWPAPTTTAPPASRPRRTPPDRPPATRPARRPTPPAAPNPGSGPAPPDGTGRSRS